MNTAKLKINFHDPRGNQLFLQLSCDLQRWQMHMNDRSWWLEREKQCIALFQHYGYDLHSGVWHCLIACQRSGWNGIASASLLLANGFSRKHMGCWPPLTAVELRRQILENYTHQLIPQIYTLPLTAVSVTALEQLFNACTQLLAQAKALQLQPRALEQLSTWLERQIRTLEQQAIEPTVPTRSQKKPQTKTPMLSVPVLVTKSVWSRKFGWAVMGAGVMLLIMLALQSMNFPEVLQKSQKLWPRNPLVSTWKRKQEAISSNLRINNSTQQMSDQLGMLEQRLLDAEQKRKPYMTISELKTTVYTIRGILDQQSSMVENQMSQLIQQQNNNQPLSPAAVLALNEQLEALRSHLLLLEYTKPLNERSTSTSTVN